MSLSGTPVGDIILRGYILPPETVVGDGGGDDDEDGSEESEEETHLEVLDMSEMMQAEAGGHMFRSSVPPRDEVNFQVIGSGRCGNKRHKVVGQFALRSPWWEVTCIARRWDNKKLKVQRRYPSYKLRSDLDREGWRSMVSLFLTACDVKPPELLTQFFEWLRPQNRHVNFFNLMEILGEFEQGGNGGAAQCLRARITDSAAGMQVHAAPLYPLVMTYLPTLLPGHFLELLKKGKGRVKSCHPQPATPSTQATPASPAVQNGNEQEMEADLQKDLSLLNQLEQILRSETDVWKLGFNYVMNKELKVMRCEAKLQAFIDCDLFDRIPLLQRNALQAYDKLKEHCRSTGSTYMEQKNLCYKLRGDTGMADDATWEAVEFLEEIGVVVRDKQKVALQNFHYYETGIARCLRDLVEGEPWIIPLNAREVLYAAAVERRRSKMQAVNVEHAVDRHGENADLSVLLPHDGNNFLVKSEPSGDGEDPESLPPIELDEDQVRAAEMICANPVTVISGKGGCGKTTVICLVFKALLQQSQEIKKACADFENDTGGSQGWDEAPVSPPGSLSRLEGAVQEEEEGKKAIHNEDEILLTAPTGRAASLLTKKTCFTAYTLHHVLCSFMKKEKDEDGCPKNWKFKSVRVLVVDEGSLVCVQHLDSVLPMLIKYAKLKKFIFLGDVRQLPSIQPGNTLCDLFQSLEVPHSWAIEMRTNHRAESELIVRNAGLIADMGMKKTYRQLEFDAIVDLKRPSKMASAEKKFIHICLPTTREASADDLQSAVKLLIDSAPGLKDHNTSQFIAFRRKDVELINELCCKHYNNHTTKDHNRKLWFQPGDKVCCTKNGDINPHGDPKNQDKLRLCNGEIFFIKEDVTKDDEDSPRKRRCRYLTLDDGDGRVITADFRELQKQCRLQHAWARTIHTFQGSENETIVYVLGNSKFETWKHMYTAVTRGQKRVYVVAKQGAIVSTIVRRETPRRTQLRHLVETVLSQSRADGADIPSPPATPRRPAPGLIHIPSTPLSSRTPVSTEKQSGPQKALSLDASGVVDDEQLGRVRSAVSQHSPSNKRLHSDETMGSPSKQIKTELQTGNPSPLGCSTLQQLSLHTPTSSKRLFQRRSFVCKTLLTFKTALKIHLQEAAIRKWPLSKS